MNRAAPLFRMSLLKEKAPDINRMFDVVSGRNIIQNSVVERIFKISDSEYDLDLVVERREGEIEKQDKYKVRIQVKKGERTRQNPFGLRISKLRETYE